MQFHSWLLCQCEKNFAKQQFEQGKTGCKDDSVLKLQQLSRLLCFNCSNFAATRILFSTCPFKGKRFVSQAFQFFLFLFFPTINLFVEIIFYCSFYTKLKIGNFLRAHKKISVSVIWHLGTSSNGYNLPILQLLLIFLIWWNIKSTDLRPFTLNLQNGEGEGYLLQRDTIISTFMKSPKSFYMGLFLCRICS